jgi:hypothetical protein
VVDTGFGGGGNGTATVAERCDRRRDERHEPVAPRERPTHTRTEVDMNAQDNAKVGQWATLVPIPEREPFLFNLNLQLHPQFSRTRRRRRRLLLLCLNLQRILL